MTDSTFPNDELEQLRAEVAELRAAVEALTNGTAEITCKRVAVVDGLGERITLDATTMGEASLVVNAYPDEHSTSIDLTAGPDDDGIEAVVGLWGGGNRDAAMRTRRSDGSDEWVAAVDVENHNLREQVQRTTIRSSGVEVYEKDLGPIVARCPHCGALALSPMEPDLGADGRPVHLQWKCPCGHYEVRPII